MQQEQVDGSRDAAAAIGDDVLVLRNADGGELRDPPGTDVRRDLRYVPSSTSLSFQPIKGYAHDITGEADINQP